MADFNYFRALGGRGESVGEFSTLQQAISASLAAMRKHFPSLKEKDLAPRVRTRSDMPRMAFTEALENRGIVEAKAVKSFNTKLRAEQRAPRPSGHIPKFNLAEDQSSPELTARYVQKFCQLNNLKHEVTA